LTRLLFDWCRLLFYPVAGVGAVSEVAAADEQVRFR